MAGVYRGLRSPPLAFIRSQRRDRKSTRLNSSHSQISYAVFCLKKKIEARRVGLALDPDVVARIDLVAISRAIDHYVARALHLGHGPITAQPDHHALDLMLIRL